ncbi:MAG TPA: endopeptidase La [Spirochaetota bacterium]|nr:endopeptidase La [Spirochaetota bacterium]
MPVKIDEKKRYPLMPLRDVVVFPHMVIPLFVGRDKSVSALDEAMKSDRLVVLAAQIDPKISEPEGKDVYSVGTICEILQMLKLPNGTIKVLVEGITRVYLTEFYSDEKIYRTDIRLFDYTSEYNADLSEKRSLLLTKFEKYISSNRKIPKEAIKTVSSIEDISHLVDAVAAHINMRLELRQNLIELADPEKRIDRMIELIDGAIEVLELEKKIQGQVRKQMEKTQKDYYLNEQMKIIKRELNNGDDELDEIEELKKEISAEHMPEEIQQKGLKEIRRLEKMPPLSAESAVVRNYIEWLKDLPWTKSTEDNSDISKAKEILDGDHYGLEEVKERILEFIAVRHLSKSIRGPIICFVGPPGVGKTSLGRSVANALNRKFIRISLGGVRDEAEIRGHRRTYVGSMPGKIIQAIKKAGTRNPVILLDEVDKMSTDFRGDPSSALLEVLDPEQNSTFVDHYIEVPYDLSEVMFITTSNVQHQIPLPLQDRMEIIEISSYTEDEKLNIARKYLLPKQLQSNGITEKHLSLSDEQILYIIRHYTRESGVRNLERTIGKICRKTAREVVEKGDGFEQIIDQEAVRRLLGPIVFKYGEKEKFNDIGLANGLAWTAVGGDVMQIEASLIPGKGQLMLTGKLGEVMQESAQAAYTYVKANSTFYSIEPKLISENDLHLHVPEGAIPKDGPSAGITMAVVIASLYSRIPVKCDVAMTGEITLRGKVLPIGGLKEKVLAAHRAGIKCIIIPEDNRKDLEKIPANILSELSIHPVSKMEEVLFLALETPQDFFIKEDFRKELFARMESCDSGRVEIQN